MQRWWFVVLVVAASLLRAQQTCKIQLRDRWADQPLRKVEALVDRDTVYTDEGGWLQTSLSRIPLIVVVKGYFPVECTGREKHSVLYLTPQTYTQEVVVVASRNQAPPVLFTNSQVIALDQTRQKGVVDVAEIINEQAGLQVKSYGPVGQLQSISVRGMGAAQTQVLFDGVPLNNLQLGAVDLSTLPLDGLERISIYPGGNAVFGGSGAIGGALHLLPTEPADHWKGFLHLAKGSFGLKKTALGLHVPLGSFRQLIALTTLQADNDYTYGKTRLTNQDFVKKGVLYRAYISWAPDWSSAFTVLHGAIQRGAPRPLLEGVRRERDQARLAQDETLVLWQMAKRYSGGQWRVRLFNRNGWMEYRDPGVIINNQPLHSVHFNRLTGIQSDVQQMITQRLMVFVSGEGYRERINSSQAGRVGRDRFAATGQFDWLLTDSVNSWGDWHVHGQWRQEWWQRHHSISLPGIGISGQLANHTVFFTVSKNFHLPGFNDLYWQPGGNPDLKPEKSWNQEAGWVWQNQTNYGGFSCQMAAYRLMVQDLIRWMPTTQGIWSPVNIGQVYGRGIEISGRMNSADELHGLRFSYRYAKTEKWKAEFAGDKTVGHQLPYVPRERWSLQIFSTLPPFKAGLTLQHTSFRYLSIANLSRDYLPAYTTLNMWAGVKFSWTWSELYLSLRVDNVTNIQYQEVRGYPMPPRTWNVHMRIAFNKTQSNTTGGKND